jgi:hypothetical protein
LTFRKLILWIIDPVEKFKFLLELINKTKSNSSSDIITEVSNYNECGNKKIKKVQDKIYKNLINEYNKIIYNFMKDGDINENNYSEEEEEISKDNEGGNFETKNEFFIKKNEVEESNFWKNKFTIEKNKIPSYLSLEICTKILKIGKSVYFIKNFSKAIDLVEEKVKDFDDLKGFFEYIELYYKSINKILNNYLFNDLRLNDHFVSIKSFLLLSQGDFVKNFLESIK